MTKRMFKIFISCLLSVTLLMCLSGFTYTEEDTLLSNEPHVYEIVPGTSEWNELTPDERLISCNVTADEVGNMTTEALVETVLNYPYLIDIYAFDTLEQGIEWVSMYFPGLPELLSREDADVTLQKYLNSEASLLSNSEIDINLLYASDILEYLTSPNTTDDEISLCGTATTVTTPAGSSVSATYNKTWADHGTTYEATLAKHEKYHITYPSVTSLRTPAPAYNCHSYAFHSTSSSNLYWIGSPAKYLNDGSYSSSTAASGRVVVYTVNGSYSHSGIIYSTSGGTVVTSKWGCAGLYRHNLTDCPYAKNVSGLSTAVYKKN